ncbi:MAG: hypothetical protein IKX76_02110, partial [Eubacterium sp.]|nr:hypothetical protein [Eubacterium sp.]
MLTDKQRQRDYEYEADYQTKSAYTAEQWTNILESRTFSEDQMSLLKKIYASYNHAATLLQLAFQDHSSQADLLESINEAGRILGEANERKAEVDYEGKEYWWYLLCWGKNTPDSTLELKLHPELTEAIGGLYPELEESYYAFVNDVDRSLQILYNQEDSVWIAAAVLLYEKYYLNPGISADDILLMQYEVQTRAQKVYGQDVNTNTITQICNADERTSRFNYLRDIYKYYRVSYPGEFDGDRERPEPENLDYNAYIKTIFGYARLTVITDFIDHEYDHLVNESYVELNQTNGFVRLAAFLSRQGGKSFSMADTSETALSLRADGNDAETTFHMPADNLCKDYPNFTFARRTGWFEEDSSRIASQFCDVLYIETYSHCKASISLQCIPEGDEAYVLTALNLPEVPDREIMADMQDKCDKLTLMSAAAFKVEVIPVEWFDLAADGHKIRASVKYPYKEFKDMTEENILATMETSLQIFASYYTDICQNYYPAMDGDREEDPLAAALGSKLVYRKAADVPDPQIIYKEEVPSPTADFIKKALQDYDRAQAAQEKGQAETVSSPATGGGSGEGRKEKGAASLRSISRDTVTVMSEHPEREEQGFRLYPKNTLIRGPLKTGKYHEAIITAVGIIEGKDRSTM